MERNHPSARVPAPSAPPGPWSVAVSRSQVSRRGSKGTHRAARRPAGGAPVRQLLPRTLVVAALAGGTCAFVSQDQAVTLDVDGASRTLHSYADTVDELLTEQGVAVGAHDRVIPAPGRALDGVERIAVRRARPLTLTLDGERRRVWTTGRTVSEALRELGVPTDGAWLSAPSGTPLPRTGAALTVRTERTVTVLADGHAYAVRTHAATVREVVAAAGVVLAGLDTTSVRPGSFPRDGQTVGVLRITRTTEHRDAPLPYGTVRTADPQAYAGTETVERAGVPGLRRTAYAVSTVNGVRQRPTAVGTEVLRHPADRLVRFGTRPLPAVVSGAEGLDWAAMARCESGGRPAAVDAAGTHGGLYQFDTATWRRLGGSGRPQDAPAAEQTYRAKKLYVLRGAAPWPQCGRKLQR
ncbi:transglycosylase [Streptomyces albus subsp. albus]|nr:transglycosylase [Streptomyces albus subsp. albus]